MKSISTEVNFSQPDELTGLFIKLKEDYLDYEIKVKEYSATTTTDGPYQDSYTTKKFPGDLTALSVTVSKGKENNYYGVKFVQGEFEGLITIKSRDELGNILSTKEQQEYEPGKFVIIPEGIDGYDLVSTEPIEVELTWKQPEQDVYIDYITKEDEDGDGDDDEYGSSYNGYTLEFATASISPTVTFEFDNTEGYDSIESVTYGFMGNNPVSASVVAIPITNPTTGKYSGVRMRITGGSGGAISIQAICYNSEGEDEE